MLHALEAIATLCLGVVWIGIPMLAIAAVAAYAAALTRLAEGLAHVCAPEAVLVGAHAELREGSAEGLRLV